MIASVSPLVNLPPTPDAGEGGAGLPPRHGGASKAPSCPGSSRTSFAIPCQLRVRRPSGERGPLSPAQPGGASTPLGNAEGTAPAAAPTPSANAPGSSYPAQHGGTTTPRRNAGGLAPGAAPARAAEPSGPAAASTLPSGECGPFSPAQPGGTFSPSDSTGVLAPAAATTPSANAPGSPYPAQHGGETTPRRNAWGLAPAAAPTPCAIAHGISSPSQRVGATIPRHSARGHCPPASARRRVTPGGASSATIKRRERRRAVKLSSAAPPWTGRGTMHMSGYSDDITKPIRACDFFCGGSGSSLGLEAAGYEIALGIDNNSTALHCFQKNHPTAKALLASIADFDVCLRALRAAQVDIATCSAPCQGFSSAGKQLQDDPRNNLTMAAARIFAAARTPIVIFENVPQCASSSVWSATLLLLRAAGYTITSAVLDACQFGVPQRRKRMFAVATQPGYEFDFAGAAAAASTRTRTCVADVMPDRQFFYHFGRGRADQCVFRSDTQCPPLRCNSEYFPRRRHLRRPKDDAGFDSCKPFSVDDMKLLQGWPARSWLPDNRRAASRIIGNSVAPPVMRWLGELASVPLRQHAAVTAGRVRSTHASCVQNLIEAQDAAAVGAHVGPLPGTTDEQQLQMHARVPDTDASYSAIHMAQIKRRERRRLTELLQNHIASDGTLRSLRDPIWSAPPTNAPPSSGNPAAHWTAKPWRVGDTTGIPTHCSTVSQRWRQFEAMHMGHCERCQAFSTRTLGQPPPVSQLRAAHATGHIPDRTTWKLDNACYQCDMVQEIRIGLNPPLDATVPPVTVPNGVTCWDKFEEMTAYMEKMEAINAFEDGVWELPDGAVCSAMHMVTRPSDHRAFLRDGTPAPVRSVVDLTKSQVNAHLPRWAFRMPGPDDAVAMLGKYPNAWLGTTDLSKFYPSLGLGPSLQSVCWIKDPRSDTTWRGTGPKSAAWIAFHAKRKAEGIRYPPYRRCSGVALGLKVAPAFACGISGEIVQFLTAIGITSTMYVDDLLIAASTREQCAEDMATAVSVFEWLGLRCNPDKQVGPARRLKYLGLIIDVDLKTVSIDDDRRLDLRRELLRFQQSTSFGTKDLETLIGKLSFASCVVKGGQAFTYRLRVCLRAALDASSTTVNVSDAARADAIWWADTLATSVGGSSIFLADTDLPVITFKSDAAGEIGWGYVLDGTMYYSRWKASTITDKHIQYKELVALVHVLEEHGELFSNKIVRAGCDNASVCYCANKLSSRCPTLMSLLRRLANSMCTHNTDIVAVHVSREFNELADLLTRHQALSDFRQLLPDGVATPSEGQTRLCRTPSPADNAPVWSVKLTRR